MVRRRGGRRAPPPTFEVDVSPEMEFDGTGNGRHQRVQSAGAFARWLINGIWSAVVWGLVCGPGVAIIAYGVDGVRTGQLRGRRWFKSFSYGEEAVGWGWLAIAVGCWALGEGLHLKTGRPVARILMNVLALGTFGVGVCILALSWAQ